MTDSDIYREAAEFVYRTFQYHGNGYHYPACSAISAVIFTDDYFSHAGYLKHHFAEYFKPEHLSAGDQWFGLADCSYKPTTFAQERMEHRVMALLFMSEIAKQPDWVEFCNKKPA